MLGEIVVELPPAREPTGLQDRVEEWRLMPPLRLAEALAESRMEQRALAELLARAREREAEQGSETAQLRRRLAEAPPSGGSRQGEPLVSQERQ